MINPSELERIARDLTDWIRANKGPLPEEDVGAKLSFDILMNDAHTIVRALIAFAAMQRVVELVPSLDDMLMYPIEKRHPELGEALTKAKEDC